MTPTLIPWPWSIPVAAATIAFGAAFFLGWLEYHHMITGAVLMALGWRLWAIGATTWGAIVFLVGFAIFVDDAFQELVKRIIRKDHRSSMNVLFRWLWGDVLGWPWPFKF